MGIEVELHSMRPARDWHASRATLLRGSYDLGNTLADALESLHLLGVPGGLKRTSSRAYGCGFSPFASIVTYFSMRRARVSGRLASWTR